MTVQEHLSLVHNAWQSHMEYIPVGVDIPVVASKKVERPERMGTVLDWEMTLEERCKCVLQQAGTLVPLAETRLLSR
eukprot:1286607-Ditylum_brightwellii.AAC.1